MLAADDAASYPLIDNKVFLSHAYSDHKECVRDKPSDRTATCNSKVLKLERWLDRPSYDGFLLHSWSKESTMMCPIVLNIPHSSTIIPDEYRALFYPIDINEELRIMTDWYTEELFAVDGVKAIVAPVSRLLVVTERFDDDEAESMSGVGMGAVYTRTSKGEALKKVTSSIRSELMTRCYYPYHKTLEAAVDNVLSNFGKAIIIDCHSFSSIPLPHEPDQRYPRPDICIGTNHYHTPLWLSESIRASAQKNGYSVAFDTPFAVTIVPLKHYCKTRGVYSVMIEINRSIYMDEITLIKNFGNFAALNKMISNLVWEIRKSI